MVVTTQEFSYYLLQLLYSVISINQDEFVGKVEQ